MTEQETLLNSSQDTKLGNSVPINCLDTPDKRTKPVDTISEEELEKEIIEKIKTKLEEENPLGGIISSEELEPLTELKKKSYSDSLYLGLLYFKCHNIFEENKSLEGIDYLLNKFKLEDDFHKLIESYETQKFGNYYIGTKIRDYVMKEKKEMSKLIDIFFSLSKQSYS